MDSCLCYCDSLLFHNFMNGHSIYFIHFIKFIYKDDTSICKNHSSCL